MKAGSRRSDLPPDWKLEDSRNSDGKTKSEEVNEINYSRTKENYERKDDNNESSSEEDIKDMLMKIVYSEGSLDADPYNAIVDTGCPKTVCGKAFMDAFITSKGEDVFIRRKHEKEHFKFGNGKVYTSTESHQIEVEIGRMTTKVWTSVIDADIPLLLGLDYLKRWGVVIDIENESIFIRKCNKSFKINSRLSNHWKLQIQGEKALHKRAHRLVLKVDLCELDDADLRKHIVKTHKNLSHKSDGQLLKLFQMAGKADTRVRKKIKEVVDSCDVCNKFKKTRPRPSVALAKANTLNEVVSLDLKEKREHRRHILYCVDEFSGYIRAAVINDKNPETILKILSRIWVREGPGIPSKGWFSDNGGEFRNEAMLEAARQLGLQIFLTAGNSPWSNGKNERNHYSCDVTIDKLLEENRNMSLEDALSHAVYAHNMQINKKGFSPIQMTFGRQGMIPGIMDGNPASLEPVVASDWFREEMINRQKSEQIYRMVDSNERLQKTWAQNTSGSADEIYNPGDVVLFKEKDKSKWSGPAKVTDVDGTKIRMLYGGYERTVPSIDVMHYKNENVVVKSNTETNENAEKEMQTEMDDAWSEVEEVPTDWKRIYDQKGMEREPNLPEGWKSKNGQDVPNLPEGWKTRKVQHDPYLPEGWKFNVPSNLLNNKRLRPKLKETVEFVVNGVLRTGKVVKVGKPTGRNKYRCWIREENSENNFDFVNEVENWKTLKNVNFTDDTIKTKKTAFNDNDVIGVNFLKGWSNVTNTSPWMENINEIYAAEIPKKMHGHPKIRDAKEEELKRWRDYGAVEQVNRRMEMSVISSRWVVTEKGEDKFKARLVVRGFEEEIYPQSDSPTASKDSFKTFLTLSANQDFSIKNMDVKSAFLQGTDLDRDVYMEPPLEVKKPGIVWKLKKTVYGLYDASRSWYLAVKEELKSFGMKHVSGDEAFFSIRRNGELFGMTVLHVDDFLVAGKLEFLEQLGQKLKKRFTFGKIEFNKFKYTGLNIEQTSSGIYVDQVEYIQSIKPISAQGLEGEDSEKLNKQQFRAYRRLTGQLAWAVENTRPDLAFDVRHLATRNKDATIGDIKTANKILKKAHYENVKVKYSHLGDWRQLKLVTFTDSSFKNSEDKVKSVGGRVTFLTSPQGLASPLSWKSRTIQQVCKSVKSAETRSLEQGMEDSIYTARIIHEVMTGKPGYIPVEQKIDSKTLYDSVRSTKPVEEKTMRHVLAWIKQQKEEEKTVTRIDWISNKLMLADILTKKGVKPDPLLRAVTEGRISLEA